MNYVLITWISDNINWFILKQTPIKMISLLLLIFTTYGAAPLHRYRCGLPFLQFNFKYHNSHSESVAVYLFSFAVILADKGQEWPPLVHLYNGSRPAVFLLSFLFTFTDSQIYRFTLFLTLYYWIRCLPFRLGFGWLLLPIIDNILHLFTNICSEIPALA